MDSEKRLYIISGCNGAGKTTASYTLLPEVFQCKEFVNADEIAKGLSPFNPEGVAIDAGKVMIQRITDLLAREETFAIETTLASRSLNNLVTKAQANGYSVKLLFFWLNSTKLAVRRVAQRVKEGGHNIPINVIKRRYVAGIRNLFKIYIPHVDNWLIADNSSVPRTLVAEGGNGLKTVVYDTKRYNEILKYVGE
ncbi:MAG: zeta toxin family protein [Muribaculaceae bacterium]|nr:zeta toxin family protein [Muribaculaceae bacterium]